MQCSRIIGYLYPYRHYVHGLLLIPCVDTQGSFFFCQACFLQTLTEMGSFPQAQLIGITGLVVLFCCARARSIPLPRLPLAEDHEKGAPCFGLYH